MAGTLYIVATPIGNLADLSDRAKTILSTVAYIACEDTRHSGILLKDLNRAGQLISCHDHNEGARALQLISYLQEGADVALISDAGTPLMSDPGHRLLKAAYAANIQVTAIPGPCAIINALVLSGLPTHSFYFGGFLPVKSGQRLNVLNAAKQMATTLIYYESPHRIVKSLVALASVFPDQDVVLMREMTKKFEQRICDKSQNLASLALADKLALKGELVLLINNQK